MFKQRRMFTLRIVRTVACSVPAVFDRSVDDVTFVCLFALAEATCSWTAFEVWFANESLPTCTCSLRVSPPPASTLTIKLNPPPACHSLLYDLPTWC